MMAIGIGSRLARVLSNGKSLDRSIFQRMLGLTSIRAT
jgi:hypothetical protein